jgi:hypothetical protein
VFAPTRLHPIRFDVEEAAAPTGPPVWDGVLEAGDALYVPRGWWHEVVAMGAPSLHLTVSVHPRGGRHLLGLLRERLTPVEAVAAALPRPTSDDDPIEVTERLRAAVEAAFDDLTLDAAFAEWDRTNVPMRPTPSLPFSVEHPVLPTTEPQRRLRLTGTRPPVLRKTAAGRTEVWSQGQRWILCDQRLALIEPLFTGECHTVGHLLAGAAGLPEDQAHPFLEDLVLAGLLQVLPPEAQG